MSSENLNFEVSDDLFNHHSYLIGCGGNGETGVLNFHRYIIRDSLISDECRLTTAKQNVV